MSGRLRILKNNKLKRKKHDHFIMIIKELLLIYNDPRKFGFIDLVKTEKIFKKKYIQNLGFDALDIRLSTDYLYEPSQEKVVRDLIPKSLKTQLFKAILDSHASEHGARMTAMHKATDNAAELKKELTLTYNKARQAAITGEILEIVGGAEALKS